MTSLRALLFRTFALAVLTATLPAAESRPDSSMTVARGSLRGALRPVDVRQLSFGVAGDIEKFGADEGQAVAAGALLVQLNSEVERADLARAEAVLERITAERNRAEREFSRVDKLWQQKIGTEKEFEEAQHAKIIIGSQQKEARANVAAAREHLKERSIYAPMAGLVERRTRSVGEAVERQEVIVRLIDISKLELVVYGSADLWGKFKAGQEVRLMVETGSATGTVVTGVVAYIDPTMNETATFRVKIHVEPTEKVLSGIEVKLQLPSEVN